MPHGLRRLQKAETLHFIPFSCFHRLPFLEAPGIVDTVQAALEQLQPLRHRHSGRGGDRVGVDSKASRPAHREPAAIHGAHPPETSRRILRSDDRATCHETWGIPFERDRGPRAVTTRQPSPDC